MTEWRRLSIVPYRAYEVSDDGRIRRGGRELAGYTDRYGYRTVQLSYAGLSRRFKVHRLICEAFHGPPPDRHEVGHLDGSRLNNAADNLRWVTRSENNRHQIAHGTARGRENLIPGQPRGQANPVAALSNEQAAEIREKSRQGLSCRTLSREYGVSKDTINHIARGISYVPEGQTPNPPLPTEPS